jgi:flagellar biosynthesis activator protein FlaF
MTLAHTATRAYQAAAESRSLREQEADLFRYANAVLRTSRNSTPMARIRAVADNKRLWSLVNVLVRDNDNQLPASLRAQVVSLGMAVMRELDRSEPDFDFVIGINENIAAGLAGQS